MILMATQAAAQTSGTPVEIVSANTMTLQKSGDSSSLTILEGGVVLKQGKTIFKCNRCVKNDRANTFEAWGNVHINDSDTTNIYSDHLRYLTDRQIAYLDGSVRLTDGRTVLTAPSVEYNMATNMATYRNGGKVVNKRTVITSRAANYYTDIKDIIFMRDVRVNDPGYNITTDSLLYNTDNQIARFITYTVIRDSAKKTMTTREGFYNLRTGDAEFNQRSSINDNNKTTVIADSLTLTEEFAQAKGQAVIVDSVRGTIIIADLIYQNRITEAVLATRNPLMIIKQGNDSIYVTADTLFSAKLTDLYNSIDEGNLLKQNVDSTSTREADMNNTETVPASADSLPGSKSETLPSRTTANRPVNRQPVLNQSDSVIAPQSVPLPRSAGRNMLPPRTARMIRDSTLRDDSTNRYFEAFHNVKIFSDSMQAVSDSLFYSFRDSVFRLYQNPVVWGKDNNQVTGDTLLLFTKNKQPHKFEAIDNAFMLTHLEQDAFNQIKSSRIDGFFTNGNLDSLRARGSVEAIYYLQDDDSAYTGINQVTQADMIDAYLKEKQLQKIVLRGQPKGTIYPIKQKAPGEMQLQGFRWREAERPKTKYDLL